MIAMTSCVKGLAVPGPPPGPCEASTVPAESSAAAGITVTAKGNIQRRFRDEAKTISPMTRCLQKIRVAAYAGFVISPVNCGM